MAFVKKDQTWDVLEQVLENLIYAREVPPGKRFRFDRADDCNYALLTIFTYNTNTYKPDEMRHTRHEFVVPQATYNEMAWVRWVFDKIASIEHHETTENFFYKGVRIYAPHHGNGWDPYAFWPGHDVREKLKAPGDD